MRVVIIGADGQLGSDLLRAFQGEDLFPLTEKDVDVADIKCLREATSSNSPDLIINTAALSNVPQCEREIERAMTVNAIGSRNVAIVADELKSSLLYVSTDYVFNGEKGSPYVEDDLTCPLNVYGVSKLAGEHFVRCILEGYFVVRTSGLYGIHRCVSKGTNFVDRMLQYSDGETVEVVCDEVLTPTYTLHLARQIYELVKKDTYGLYHVTNEGECSWFEFAKTIFSFLDRDVKIVPVDAKDFQSALRRPRYSVLENKKLNDMGINLMPHWRDSLRSYLIEKGFKVS